MICSKHDLKVQYFMIGVEDNHVDENTFCCAKCVLLMDQSSKNDRLVSVQETLRRGNSETSFQKDKIQRNLYKVAQLYHEKVQELNNEINEVIQQTVKRLVIIKHTNFRLIDNWIKQNQLQIDSYFFGDKQSKTMHGLAQMITNGIEKNEIIDYFEQYLRQIRTIDLIQTLRYDEQNINHFRSYIERVRIQLVKHFDNEFLPTTALFFKNQSNLDVASEMKDISHQFLQQQANYFEFMLKQVQELQKKNSNVPQQPQSAQEIAKKNVNNTLSQQQQQQQLKHNKEMKIIDQLFKKYVPTNSEQSLNLQNSDKVQNNNQNPNNNKQYSQNEVICNISCPSSSHSSKQNAKENIIVDSAQSSVQNINQFQVDSVDNITLASKSNIPCQNIACSPFENMEIDQNLASISDQKKQPQTSENVQSDSSKEQEQVRQEGETQNSQNNNIEVQTLCSHDETGAIHPEEDQCGEQILNNMEISVELLDNIIIQLQKPIENSQTQPPITHIDSHNQSGNTDVQNMKKAQLTHNQGSYQNQDPKSMQKKPDGMIQPSPLAPLSMNIKPENYSQNNTEQFYSCNNFLQRRHSQQFIQNPFQKHLVINNQNINSPLPQQPHNHMMPPRVNYNQSQKQVIYPQQQQSPQQFIPSLKQNQPISPKQNFHISPVNQNNPQIQYSPHSPFHRSLMTHQYSQQFHFPPPQTGPFNEYNQQFKQLTPSFPPRQGSSQLFQQYNSPLINHSLLQTPSSLELSGAQKKSYSPIFSVINLNSPSAPPLNINQNKVPSPFNSTDINQSVFHSALQIIETSRNNPVTQKLKDINVRQIQNNENKIIVEESLVGKPKDQDISQGIQIQPEPTVVIAQNKEGIITDQFNIESIEAEQAKINQTINEIMLVKLPNKTPVISITDKQCEAQEQTNQLIQNKQKTNQLMALEVTDLQGTVINMRKIQNTLINISENGKLTPKIVNKQIKEKKTLSHEEVSITDKKSIHDTPVQEKTKTKEKQVISVPQINKNVFELVQRNNSPVEGLDKIQQIPKSTTSSTSIVPQKKTISREKKSISKDKFEQSNKYGKDQLTETNESKEKKQLLPKKNSQIEIGQIMSNHNKKQSPEQNEKSIIKIQVEDKINNSEKPSNVSDKLKISKNISQQIIVKTSSRNTLTQENDILQNEKKKVIQLLDNPLMNQKRTIRQLYNISDPDKSKDSKDSSTNKKEGQPLVTDEDLDIDIESDDNIPKQITKHTFSQRNKKFIIEDKTDLSINSNNEDYLQTNTENNMLEGKISKKYIIDDSSTIIHQKHSLHPIPTNDKPDLDIYFNNYPSIISNSSFILENSDGINPVNSNLYPDHCNIILENSNASLSDNAFNTSAASLNNIFQTEQQSFSIKNCKIVKQTEFLPPPLQKIKVKRVHIETILIKNNVHGIQDNSRVSPSHEANYEISEREGKADFGSVFNKKFVLGSKQAK